MTTNAFQGPNVANDFADTLEAKSGYGLDDSGAYSIGIATAFEAQASAGSKFWDMTGSI